MRLYRLDHQDPDHGTMVEWFSSMRAASRREIELIRAELPTYPIQVVNLPRGKAAMLIWLNSNFQTDNG